MRVGPFHLTYCSNIHAGETWTEVQTALASVLPDVRRSLAAEGPFAIGLRLSAAAAWELGRPAALDAFRRFLRDGNYYVFTINGFPYGEFHRQRVKENVYLPDWRDPRRVAYSNQLASILAALLPDDVPFGSVSTVPGAFKQHANGADDLEAIAAGVREHARFLKALRDDTGRAIWLALEPEPACVLETIDETRAFFDRYLGDDISRAHVGVCVDTCHMAVEFEDPSAILGTLRAAGIAVPKVQVSSALSVTGSSPGSRDALRAFADDTYLHQVVARCGHDVHRFVDLPEALAGSDGAGCDWRVHFHVPLFLKSLGALESTQPFVSAFLSALRETPVCTQLEVETYTWDVLPAAHRNVDVATAIARELAWVRDQLA
jgi:hypothetical protein